MLKGHRSQFDGANSGQIRNNSRITINDAGIDKKSWSGEPIPSSTDLPNPGIEPGSPALQVDSLPAELPGRPYCDYLYAKLCLKVVFLENIGKHIAMDQRKGF